MSSKRLGLVTGLLFLAFPGCSSPANPDPTLGGAVALCKKELFGEPLDLRRVGSEGIAINVQLLDSRESETQLTLTQRGQQKPELRVLTTVGGSVRHQLDRLRGANPDIGQEAACGMVKVRLSTSEKIDSTRLATLIDEFQSLEVKPTIDAPFVIHGIYYDMWVFSAANYSYFQFQGVPEQTEAENPLQRWVDRLVRLAG